MKFCLSPLPCHFSLTLCCLCCFWNSFLFRSALRYRKVSLSPLPAGNETLEYAQGENKLISGFWSLDCFCNEFVILLFSLPSPSLSVSSLCVSELLGAAKRVNVNIQDADGWGASARSCFLCHCSTLPVFPSLTSPASPLPVLSSFSSLILSLLSLFLTWTQQLVVTELNPWVVFQLRFFFFFYISNFFFFFSSFAKYKYPLGQHSI